MCGGVSFLSVGGGLQFRNFKCFLFVVSSCWGGRSNSILSGACMFHMKSMSSFDRYKTSRSSFLFVLLVFWGVNVGFLLSDSFVSTNLLYFFAIIIFCSSISFTMICFFFLLFLFLDTHQL